MPRNTLSDLNNHLFEQLERLNDEDLSEEEINKEVKRANAMNVIAKNIIYNARTVLSGITIMDEYHDKNKAVPDQFRLTQKKKTG